MRSSMARGMKASMLYDSDEFFAEYGLSDRSQPKMSAWEEATARLRSGCDKEEHEEHIVARLKLRPLTGRTLALDLALGGDETEQEATDQGKVRQDKAG